MTNFKPLCIGEAGREYVLSMMESIPGLCSALAPAVASIGDCYAIVAQDMPFAKVLQFNGGAGDEAFSRSDWLLQRLSNLTEAGRRGVLLVQDLWFTPQDHQGEPRPRTDFWFNGDEVYFWQEFGPNCTPRVSLLLREPHSFNVVAFLIEDPSVASNLRAGSADISVIARGVKEIYASAYDQESFVMWMR